jgi:hypothetical protein
MGRDGRSQGPFLGLHSPNCAMSRMAAGWKTGLTEAGSHGGALGVSC